MLREQFHSIRRFDRSWKVISKSYYKQRMICDSCWMLLQWLMHTVSHLKQISYPLLLTPDCNNHKNSSSWLLDLLPLLFSFPPDPAPFIILMQQKWEKKNSRSHFINCYCMPKHISSLKHLDISVFEVLFIWEHFSPLLVKYASQSCRVWVCVCVFSPVHLPDTFCGWAWCTI